MAKKMSKLLALLLACSMILSVMSVMALAEENGPDPTVGEGQAEMTPGTGGEDTGAPANGGANAGDPDAGKDEDPAGAPADPQDTEPGSDPQPMADSTPSDPEAGSGSEAGKEGDSTPEEETAPVMIGAVPYDTLNEAVAAAGKDDIIVLNEGCELTVSMIDHAITVNGQGNTISVPKQNTYSGGLAINAPVTFRNTVLDICNPDTETPKLSWSVTMSSDGVLTLDEGSVCTVRNAGIYANLNAAINVLGASRLEVRDTMYTAMMCEKSAYLNVSGGSALTIEHAYWGDGEPNGITRFKINVTGSSFRVLNCENQGLVRCWLTLDDHATAEISGNDYGMSGYTGTEVLTMKNGASLEMNDNHTAGIFLYGGTVDVQDGTTLTITGTGSDRTEATDDRYAGAVSVYRYYDTYQASVTFADGATVNLVDNGVSAINNDGVLYVGSGTTIMRNGSKALYGGGIQNRGQATLAEGVQLYNNHAQKAGDDLYNTTGAALDKATKQPVTYRGVITFHETGAGWKLDGEPDCEHEIFGWFDDQEGNRWCADREPRHIEAYTAAESVDKDLALKAAHPLVFTVSYVVSGDIPDGYVTPAGQTFPADSPYTVEQVPSSVSGTKDGVRGTYTFTGWKNEAGSFVSGTHTLTDDVTLYGVWTFTAGSSGDGGNPGKPDPKPDPVEIPDDSTPLDPTPGEDLDDPDVPTTDLPDEDIPMAEVPQTGDASALWLALTALSGSGLAGLGFLGRKKRDEA